MPSGRMLFATKNFWRCKNPLESADHYLFVKLRAGREICFFVVVIVNLKSRRSPLGITAYKSWGLEFGEPFFGEGFAKAGNYRSLDGENIASALRSNCKR